MDDGYLRFGPPRRNKYKWFIWEVIPGNLSRGVEM